MRKLIFICIYLSLTIPCATGTIYVNAGAAGANDGTTWTDAYIYLQDALTSAASGDDIWVAAGTYYPSVGVGGTSSRYQTFQMKNGVAIYGGFRDGGSDFANRDPNQYETILSGDLLGNDNPSTLVEDLLDDPSREDNCYHVFYNQVGLNLDPNAVLDGFIITAGNSTYDRGGGMYNDNSSPTVTSCVFTGNSAKYHGGGMFNEYSSPTVTGCTFTGNWANYDGGGMFNIRSSPTATSCIFTGNSANYGGGGMFNESGSPTVTGCTFTGNSAYDRGGGMYNDGYSSRLTVTDCLFADNRGGGMYNDYNSSPTVTDCSFANNYGGSGMSNSHYSSPTVTDCSFANNYGGSGMYNDFDSNPTVTGCTFIGNSSSDKLGGKGGGMRNSHNSSPTVTDCTFTGNSAKMGINCRGGGMYNDGSPTVINCTFTTNSVYAGTFNHGGGMYNSSFSSTTLIGCTFTENSASEGGGMYNYYSNNRSTVTNCTFSNNLAEDGGGMYNYYSSPTVTNCTFIGNSAEYGGGMWNTYGRSTITNCTFTDNFAYSRGGGIYNYRYSSPTTSHCKFTGNLADYGAGMFNYDRSNAILTNCLFSSNSAEFSGGGMLNIFSSPTLTNSTFADNSAQYGGGMHNSLGSDFTLKNCIFSGNTADHGNEIALYISSTINVDHCDVKAGLTGIYDDGAGNIINWGAGNIDVDPLFADPNDGDFHLSVGSPCIDAGDNSVVDPNSTDLDGNPRIIDGDEDGQAIVDMGAYEFFNTPPIADAGQDIEASADSACVAAVTLDGSASSDEDGDELTYRWYYECELFAEGLTAEAILGLGAHEFILIVNDGMEDSEPDEVVITVVDNTPPEFSVVMNPSELWPPNHEMVKVEPVFAISDNCSDDITIELVDITSDEGDENDYSTEDGVYLRAERDGYGDGRVYILTYRAEDESGNISLGRAEVFVPHDQGQHYQGKPGDRNNDLFINYLDFAELRIQTEAAPSSDSDLLEALVLLAENWLE